MSRPGAELIAPLPQVCLAPTLTAAEASGWFATFHTRSAPYAGAGAGAGKEPVFPVEVYVDIATQPVWAGPTIRAIDLDLDVVRGLSRSEEHTSELPSPMRNSHADSCLKITNT